MSVLKTLKWRNIGPFRGGRVAAVAGVESQPTTYYFGGVGGGVWKSTNSGSNWQSVTDGQPLGTSSIGAVAVAESDPNVVYVGTGEYDIRGNVSHGDGMYKSMDAGKTWKHIGLENTRQIARVRVHPRNPDLVYVAALGHVWAPNEDRGVYRSKDGGKTWEKILSRGPKAGAIELVLDPTNPNILYAGFWEVYRKPWDLESGGPGSGIFKSTDGGDTWNELTKNPGLPKGVIGNVGLSVSAANPERIYALIEADGGGVFRSDNGGKTWQKMNGERKLLQRAWYYGRIFADPKDPNKVYATNVEFFRSDDGGKTWNAIATPHGDNHDLWISANDPQRMIEGNDGGSIVTNDGGRNWSTVDNQPTAQFYRVALDNDFPYNGYGAQQDNTTVKIATRSATGGITERNWYPVGGGESGWIAPWPKDTDVVFAGSYDGLITRYDHKNGQIQNVTVWPDNEMGWAPKDLKYRFQWNFPLLFSAHDPDLLLAGGNVLFASKDQGISWKPISGDLTRNDKSKQISSGGPITKDNTSIEYYDTIFTVIESPIQKGLIWAGSDDGLVHLTRDGGQHWDNVTPKIAPEWIQINSIEASPFDAGTAYVAATLYKFDDNRPFLYKTTDFGKSWKQINEGIPTTTFTRCIREDPNKKDLLYAGTETGIYVSFNGGEKWQSLQLNLPVTPIADLAIHKREHELVAATQGRAFWILDDTPLLAQLTPAVATESAHLFAPKHTYRMAVARGFGRTSTNEGANPPTGAVVYYWLKDKPKGDVMLELLDDSGKLVKKFSSAAPAKKAESHAFSSEEEQQEEGPRRGGPPARVTAEAGLNRFEWDLRYPDAVSFPGMVLWAANVRGPLVVPGSYQVRLTVEGKTQIQKFEVRKDPRVPTTGEQYTAQLQTALQMRDKVSQTNQAVIDIREVRDQIDELVERLEADKAGEKSRVVLEKAKSLTAELTGIEESLYQTKNRASEDPLNFPVRLNNKLAALLTATSQADAQPTASQQQVYEDLATGVNAQVKKLKDVMSSSVPALNKMVRDQDIPAITIKSAEATK
ncbi:MAG: WD40/YVTN/BNR-like repeat-containing protein [Bryobacteraceae bacterium]